MVMMKVWLETKLFALASSAEVPKPPIKLFSQISPVFMGLGLDLEVVAIIH